MSVNKVILIGNLGKDPESKTLESGAKVTSFTIATSESYKDKNSGEKITKTEWHNIVVWRGLADVAEKYLKKGSQVYIEGKIQSRTYEDKKEGVTKYFTEIIGNNMTMLGSGKGSENGSSAPADEAESKVDDYAKKKTAPAAPAAPVANTQDDDDDLPF